MLSSEIKTKNPRKGLWMSNHKETSQGKKVDFKISL